MRIFRAETFMGSVSVLVVLVELAFDLQMECFDVSRQYRSAWWIQIDFPAWTQFRNDFHASLQTLAYFFWVWAP